MTLTNEIKNDIILHSHEIENEECCGLLILNENNKFDLFKCKNIAEDKANFFVIDPKNYLQASLQGKIVACYHSHCGDYLEFTDFDILNAEEFKLFYILYCLKDKSFKIYEPKGYEIPYVNRQYVAGFIDCFSIIKDYYRKEKNIQISDLDHEYRFVDDKSSHPDNNKIHLIYPNHFKQNNFKEVNDLKKYDIILMKSPNIPSPVHAAIYLGDNSILHHPYKRNSLIEPYRSIHKSLTTHILRHDSLL